MSLFHSVNIVSLSNTKAHSHCDLHVTKHFLECGASFPSAGKQTEEKNPKQNNLLKTFIIADWLVFTDSPHYFI